MSSVPNVVGGGWDRLSSYTYESLVHMGGNFSCSIYALVFELNFLAPNIVDVVECSLFAIVRHAVICMANWTYLWALTAHLHWTIAYTVPIINSKVNVFCCCFIIRANLIWAQIRNKNAQAEALPYIWTFDLIKRSNTESSRLEHWNCKNYWK